MTTGNPGFAAPDAKGEWDGLDVAVCRAVAAAALGDPKAVEFVSTSPKVRFTSLSSGEVDILSFTTTWTFTRDVDLKFEFAGINYYDGQGFLVPTSLGAKSVKDLNGATICIQTGTTTEANLTDFFRANNMTYEPVPVDEQAAAQQQYLAGACDAFTADASNLASMRSSFAKPEEHVVLPDIISKEPVGPLVRQSDPEWGDLVRWTLNALIAAEELGVTASNADEMAKSSNNPEVKRLLGSEGGLGKMLKLDDQWALRAIKAGGNYGELFEKNVGKDSPLGLQRGPNAQWKDGGLMYAYPFR